MQVFSSITSNSSTEVTVNDIEISLSITINKALCPNITLPERFYMKTIIPKFEKLTQEIYGSHINQLVEKMKLGSPQFQPFVLQHLTYHFH